MVAERLRGEHLAQLDDVRVLDLLPEVDQRHALGVHQPEACAEWGTTHPRRQPAATHSPDTQQGGDKLFLKLLFLFLFIFYFFLFLSAQTGDGW